MRIHKSATARQQSYAIILTAIFTILLCGMQAQAGTGKAILARMKARLPEINKLKAQGIIGETSDGFLASVGNSKDGAPLLKAENDDRKKVYTAIARQQGTDPVLVGQRRALQIKKIAKPGVWLRNDKGKWHKK